MALQVTPPDIILLQPPNTPSPEGAVHTMVASLTPTNPESQRGHCARLPRLLNRTVIAIAIALLIMTTRSAMAAPPEPPPCAPENTTANHCLVAAPFLVDQLSLRAAGDGLAFATVTSPGDAQMRVLDVATLATRGVLPLNDMPLLFQAGYLYTAATSTISGTTSAQWVLNVQAADRPAIVGDYALTATPVDWAISPNALFALTAPSQAMDEAPPSSDLHDLQAFALDDPARPQWTATLPGLAATSLYAHAGALYTAGADGLTVIDATNPHQLSIMAAARWPNNVALTNVKLAGVKGYIYAMGSVATTGSAFCAIFDVHLPAQPVASGDCPFIAGKSTFAGNFVYVNPNTSPAEYLDYAIYTLANPAAPERVGVTTQRWRIAYALPEGIIAQLPSGRIARLRLSANGALTVAASTWNADELKIDGTVRAVAGDTAIVDRGASGNDGGRVLQLVTIGQRSAPTPRGVLISPWIGARYLEVEGAQLFALHRDRFTIFDLRNTAHPVQTGQFASPLGDSLEHMIPAGPQTTFLLSERNTLLSVESSTPTTPTLIATIDLPGRTKVAARANRTLYLFAQETLLIVDVANPANPHLVRSVDVPAPIAVTAWRTSLYLVDEDALHVLDLSDAASPLPVALLKPPAGMRFTLLGAARAGRLALQLRRAPGGAAVQPYLAIYDLAQPFQPRLAALLPGDFTEAWFDGDRLVLPGMRVVTIGPAARWTAPLPAAHTEAFTLAPNAELPPGVAITYTLAATTADIITATESATNADDPSYSPICLLHENDPNRPWLPLLGQSTYAGPFTVRTVLCSTGAPAPMAAPIALTLTLPRINLPPYAWTQAVLYIDAGSAWTPFPGAQMADSVWNATIAAPMVWGVCGPMPDPVLLPWVARGGH